MAERDINILIRASDYFTATFKKAESSLSGLMMPVTALNQGIELVKNVFNALGQVIKPVVEFMNSAVVAAEESEKVYHKLQIQIENNGRAWESSKDVVEGFTRRIQILTTYTDEQAAGALSRAAFYTESLGEAMKMTEAAMKLAYVKEIDLTTAIELMGRALKGHTETLARYGLVLDENLEPEQRYAALLDLINSKVQGGPQRELETYTGKMQNLTNRMDEQKESIGKALLPLKAFSYEVGYGLLDAAMKGMTGLGLVDRELKVLVKSVEDAANNEMFEKVANFFATFGQKPDVPINIDKESSKNNIDEYIKSIESKFKMSQTYFDEVFRLPPDKSDISNNEDRLDEWNKNISQQLSSFELKFRVASNNVMIAVGEMGYDLSGLSEEQLVAIDDMAGYQASLMKTQAEKAIEFSEMARDSVKNAANSIVDGMMQGQVRMKDIFKNMAGDFLKYFINKMIDDLWVGFIPKLLKIMGSIFDTPANDAMAARQGADFARHFTSGMDKYFKGANLAGMITGHTRYTGAMAAGGSVVVNIQGNIIGDSDYIVKQIEKAVDTGRSRLQITGGNRVFQY